MLGIVAILTAQPGKGDALAAEMSRIAVEVRKEEGNHGYTVHQSVDDGDTSCTTFAHGASASCDEGETSLPCHAVGISPARF